MSSELVRRENDDRRSNPFYSGGFWWCPTPTLALLSLNFLLLTFFFLHHHSLPADNHRRSFLRHPQEGRNECDMSVGKWIADERELPYTNRSCRNIPPSANCLSNGRGDTGFLKWRWKPDACELPRFDSTAFFRIVRGKKMMFVGDSVARNHMESLLCTLSQEEVPLTLVRDPNNRFKTLYFRRHGFTLGVLWTRFLVEGAERAPAGSDRAEFDLHLDTIDDGWGGRLTSVDYVVVSSAHWFFKRLYIRDAGLKVGSTGFNETGVPTLTPAAAAGMALRRALDHMVYSCDDGATVILRTFSPTHFEGAAWDAGGTCERTAPVHAVEAGPLAGGYEIRDVQNFNRW